MTQLELDQAIQAARVAMELGSPTVADRAGATYRAILRLAIERETCRATGRVMLYSSTVALSRATIEAGWLARRAEAEWLGDAA